MISMFHVFVEDMSLQYKEEHHALPGIEDHGGSVA
jgi:hypothetical protein